jgi:hypothetical protein
MADRELRLRRARRAAAALLHRWGLDGPLEAPVDVEGLARAMGIKLVPARLDGPLARVVHAGRVAMVRLSDRHDHPGQLRFSIAHELGHLELGHSTHARLCAAPELHAFGDDDRLREQEANAFASELLLPEASVRRRCEVSPVDLSVVRGIAEDFGMSMVATAITFVELTSERCAVVLSQERRVRWAVRSEMFWPTIQRGQNVSPWSLAYDYFARGDVSGERDEVDARAWIDGTQLGGREPTLHEHALVLPQMRAVMSLLWIPES